MCCWCLLLTINRESYWVIQKNERIGRRASKILASFHQFLQTLQENRELVGSCWVFTKSFKEDEADFMETGGKNQRIYWQFQGGFQDVFKYFKFFFKRSEKSMEYFLKLLWSFWGLQESQNECLLSSTVRVYKIHKLHDRYRPHRCKVQITTMTYKERPRKSVRLTAKSKKAMARCNCTF